VTEKPDANPHVAWSLALGKQPSVRLNALYDATVALRTEVTELRAEIACRDALAESEE
jgi:hypothetical protein